MSKILAPIALTILCLNASAQNMLPGQLANKLFTAFSTNNVEEYKSLMLDSASYALFTESFSKKNNTQPAMQGMIDDVKKRFTREADSANPLEFKRLVNEGIKLGINWALAKEEKFTFREDSLINRKYKSLSGNLGFTFNNKHYVIAGIEAMLFPQGYKIISVAKVLKGNVARYFEVGRMED